MAYCKRFVCKHCQRDIEAWSDGNPYYFDAVGNKNYAHHPDHESLARCIGNDVPYLCLACGNELKVDSRAPEMQCPSCQSANIADLFKLTGRKCPYCKVGKFAQDPDIVAIS